MHQQIECFKTEFEIKVKNWTFDHTYLVYQ